MSAHRNSKRSCLTQVLLATVHCGQGRRAEYKAKAHLCRVLVFASVLSAMNLGCNQITGVNNLETYDCLGPCLEGESPLVVASSKVDFGTSQCRARGEARIVKMTNTSGAPMPWKATLGKQDSSPFQVNPSEGILEAFDSISLNVTPKFLGPNIDVQDNIASDELTVSAEGVPTRTIQLSQNAVGPVVTFDPPFLAFGDTAIGVPEERVVRVFNTGNSVAELGFNAEGESLRVQPSTLTVPAGEVRDLRVVLTASALGGGSREVRVTAVRDDLCGPNPANLAVSFTGVEATGSRIAAGNEHTCSVIGIGRVACWGSNLRGELGKNSERFGQPVLLPDLEGVASLAAGAHHTCAVLRAGGTACWGDGHRGQLGHGELTGLAGAPPVKVRSPVEFVSAAAGTAHTCGLRKDQRVACFGDNTYGQLGRPTSLPLSADPVVLEELADVTAVDVSGNHSCALRATGEVLCWGANSSGQLGTEPSFANPVPTPVPLPARDAGSAKALALGTHHSCALKRDGTVVCWGESAQLLRGSAAAGPQANLADNTNGIVAMGAHGLHSCALNGGGELSCWGNNGAGQLGRPASVSELPGAVLPALKLKFTSFAVGGTHTCAIRSDLQTVCWGSNRSGQLGADSPDQRGPTTVLFPSF